MGRQRSTAGGRREGLGAGRLQTEDSTAVNGDGGGITAGWAATGITAWIRLNNHSAVCRQDAGPGRTDGKVSWKLHCWEEKCN